MSRKHCDFCGKRRWSLLHNGVWFCGKCFMAITGQKQPKKS